jgi:DNA-binding transcriptional ArsR family regulator
MVAQQPYALHRIYRLRYIPCVTSTSRRGAVTPVFSALAEPSRVLLLEALKDGEEQAVGDLVRRTRMPQPTVSKHLRVLREAGLVVVRVDAQRRLYRLRPDPLRRVADWLEPYRVLWDARLDDLEAELDRMR